ncbi:MULTISPECIES: hypothetical protein [unclassified Oceanispirochaeta]|uniref:hypothetical protein n=1 Tax=unclassified Oceanispirochaeta TaxID=2635722 RepID=UPI000E09474A|nr:MULTISPECIES: hypothetical protein [unclassified Oceanispirochaeta]MBF9017937.1 hypothetical protein [Oceanispirochaeta sp. M2]NPD74448.1 hypothetical protein [Oceanispirochaeta sp. M1]RDG29749.1 hypothetical protein DV872_20305 [Oceanispirochaeta sp. M1]
MSVNIDFLGKKIVFVNPPDLVKGPIMEILTDEELEVYVLMDHQKIPAIVAKYPDTIFFINVDAVQVENEWQIFIENLNSVNPGIQIGIMSFKITDPEQVQYYLLDLGVSCGFIQLKQGTKAASDMMMKVLKANEVKGRRKYIRYQCNLEDRAAVNFSLFDTQVNGEILDISSVGMSCTLGAHQGLVQNQLIRNTQMRLRGVIVNTDVILIGSRVVSGEQSVYVFLFKADAQAKVKEKVRFFIFNAFQKSFNKEFSLRQ